MYIDYDPAKNAINRRKHRVDLEDAKLVLLDPMALVREDACTEGEHRFVAVGRDARAALDGGIHLSGTGRHPDHFSETRHQEGAASLPNVNTT